MVTTIVRWATIHPSWVAGQKRKEHHAVPLKHLPAVQGILQYNVPLAPKTWFRVGGHAEVLFEPLDIQDLSTFLKYCPSDIPITVLGMTSNLLIRDGGISGIVIKLGKGFRNICNLGTYIVADAGLAAPFLAMYCCRIGQGGFEFFSGIPGTLGGMIRMNAGAFGASLCDVLVAVEALDRSGKLHTLTHNDLKFSYRHCHTSEELLFVRATLKGYPDKTYNITQRIHHIKTLRQTTQPINSRTGGSTFVNPSGIRAWELIDQAGCRGLTYGGAKVSEKHCNFILNMGNATAFHLETLGTNIQQRVLQTTNHLLQWEIQRIGIPLVQRQES